MYIKEKLLKQKHLWILGNLLKESISNLPVIIVEKNALTSLIDSFILDNIDNILGGKWLEETNSKIYEYQFRIIPFSSLGNKNGLLLGFKPDYIKLYTEEECIKKEVIVGIYTESLCGNLNEYSAIVGL